ncbi:MAG: acyltransferase [Telmatospirillum sp.]|nr:acyltransferase [Telmatospirillum sp.]
MRFAVLDSLRGLCALIVVIFHIEVIGCIYDGALHGFRFFEHGFLFVDFFFVLSGFVLTHSYFLKLCTPRDLLPFIVRRLGRVYPLHLLFLCLFIGLELVKFYAYRHGVAADTAPFTGAYTTPAIASNLFLLQALHLHQVATWNSPSWSISTEFYTYLIFAVFVVAAHRRTAAAVTVAALISIFGATVVLFFSRHQIDTTFDFGFFRCLYGFFCGVIAYFIANRAARRISLGPTAATGTELGACIAVVAFVTKAGLGPASLFAPLVFMTAVIVFSFEAGLLSRMLSAPPFAFLGRLSYTMYIAHAFFLVLAGRVMRVAQTRLEGLTYIRLPMLHGGNNSLIVMTSEVRQDILLAGMLLVLMVFCAGVNRFIEVPCQRWFNSLAARLVRRPAAIP